MHTASRSLSKLKGNSIIIIIQISRKPPVHAASDSFPLERSSEGRHLWSGLSSEFAGGDHYAYHAEDDNEDDGDDENNDEGDDGDGRGG